MCPSAPRVCSEPGGQKPVLSLSLDRIRIKYAVFLWYIFVVMLKILTNPSDFYLPIPPTWNCQSGSEIIRGPDSNIKMSSYPYRKSHCGDKTVIRSYYLHNGISYTGKMSSLYWIGAQTIMRKISQIITSTIIATWWRHEMETFSALLALAGNPPVTGEFPTQRPVARGIDVFFDLRLE